MRFHLPVLTLLAGSILTSTPLTSATDLDLDLDAPLPLPLHPAAPRHADVSGSRHRRAHHGSRRSPSSVVSHIDHSPKKKRAKTCKSKSSQSKLSTPPSSSGSSGSCFPAVGFNMPDSVPDSSDGWWCSQKDEYAFMGFSYAVDGCPSKGKMTSDFKNMRSQWNARYVRLYSACDRDSFSNDVINAAWDAGVGLHMLIWFGFDGGDKWKSRKANIMSAVKNNKKAPFVVRSVVVGSEPLFDSVLPVSALASQVDGIKDDLSYLGIGSSVSDMPYAFQQAGGAKPVLSAVSTLMGNILPFFDGQASTANNAWSAVQWNINWFKQNGNGKKIIMAQTGWPSNTAIWPSNNGRAVASTSQSRDYYKLLDSKCSYFKKQPQGGAQWFAHVYDDATLSGWGVTSNGKARFSFNPRTSC